MPLSCKHGENTLFSFDFDAAGWAGLKASNASEKNMRMTCCDEHVTLKTSKLGTQFFAHKRRGECTSAAETAEHLFVKACIAKAIRGTGWEVNTEQRGQAPDGSVWVADVMASRGAHRIAFEMQWSAQSSDETARRQEQYRSSGVRGLWLFRHPSAVQVSKDIPSLHVEVQLDPALAWVSIPHETPYGSKKMEYQWGPKIELGRFVRGCLARKFIWAPGIEQVVPLEVFTADQVCWRCKRPTSIVTRLVFRVDLLVPGARSVSLKMGNFDNPVGRTVLAQALGSADLRALGIGQVKERFSRTRGHAYLSNGCVHCDALQGAFFEHEVYGEDAATLTVDCTMDSKLFDGAWSDSPFRWVFDERFEPFTAALSNISAQLNMHKA